MDMKTFENRLAYNTGAYQQVKKLVKQLKPRELDINISTEFNITFRLNWPVQGIRDKSLVIRIESWGLRKGILIDGYGGIKQPNPVYMALTKSNINKIYSVGVKFYKDMI